MKSPVTCFVCVLLAVYTVSANDYSNGNFEMPTIPSREVMRCMGKFQQVPIQNEGVISAFLNTVYRSWTFTIFITRHNNIVEYLFYSMQSSC